MLVLFLAGCEASPKAGEDVLAQAEYHCLEQEWDQAIPLLRQYLADHPRHAGAHFYLGRSYLNSSDPWLVLAEGELETALRLFIQQGKVSPIKRFSDSYFEQICHIERSKVFLKQVLYVADHPGKLHGAVPVPDILAKCRQALDAAKRIAPDSPDVKNLESILRRMTAPARPKRRPRSHLPAT